MNVDILGLEAFLAIARQGHFTKAARELHLTQTALSRRLQQFEDQLGVKLVERTTRSVSLTPVGEHFLPQARRLVRELRAALVEIRETGLAERGDVSIACVPTVGIQFLPQIIQEYAKRHPENRIQIYDHASADVIDAVLRREVEFGIAVAGTQHPELTTRPLLEDRFVLICREDHPLARRRRLAWDKLGGHSLVFVGSESGNRPLLDTALAADPPILRIQYEVQRSSTAVGLVAAGAAAAIVPRLALQPGAYPNVRVIPLVEPIVSRSLVLVLRTGAHLSPAARALFDLLVRHAKRPN